MSVGDQFARLTSLLQTSLGNGVDFIDNLTSWERGLDEYEAQTGDKLPDSIRIAQLMGQAPEPLRTHLTLTSATTDGTNQDKWQKLKKIAIDFTRANTTAAPMDVGNIQDRPLWRDVRRPGGPRKGKKGGGKDDRPRPGKGDRGPEKEKTEHVDGYCGRCGRYGHRQRDCVAKKTVDGRALQPNAPRGSRQAAPVLTEGEPDEDEAEEEPDDDEPEPDEDEDIVAATTIEIEDWCFAVSGKRPPKSSSEESVMVDSGCTRSVCGPEDFP
ncbi:MAG: hypothetical protein GY704_14010, partial [Phycisphaeraceae bacterium]|nr:hypothetical protein [Phycisphaeraceae bacterium]